MKNYLKKFESFQTHDEIHEICEMYDITNYTINQDGWVDVYEDVDLSNTYLEELPLYFGLVYGNFDCSYNNLTTLEGAPKSISGHFDCSHSNITTLHYGPKHIGLSFICSFNYLTTLQGAPLNVLGDFDCSECDLTTLEGAPKFVDGDFKCFHNNLTTLEGAPQSVNGHFDCSYNKLTTLKGAPQSVDGEFDCSANKDLKSLYYLPQYISNDIVFFRKTAVYEIFKLFDDYSTSMIRYVNDFKVVKDGKIDIEMLNDLLYDQGKPPVENVKGYDNI